MRPSVPPSLPPPHPLFYLRSLTRAPPPPRRRTWVLTTEPVLEPPALLRRECEKAGVGADEFLVPALGETVLF